MSQPDLFPSENANVNANANASGAQFKKQKMDDMVESSVSNFVKLKFVYNKDNEETYFKVHLKTKFERVFESYLQFKKLQHKVDFLYDGTRINPTFTIEQLGIEDGDEIHVMSKMYGGGLWMNFCTF